MSIATRKKIAPGKLQALPISSMMLRPTLAWDGPQESRILTPVHRITQRHPARHPLCEALPQQGLEGEPHANLIAAIRPRGCTMGYQADCGQQRRHQHDPGIGSDPFRFRFSERNRLIDPRRALELCRPTMDPMSDTVWHAAVAASRGQRLAG